eukprot:3079568-Heterocapsa_arctica.AAC.1
MTTAVQEGQFVQHILDELGQTTRLQIYSDSSAARSVVARMGVGRMKHLAVRDLWLQDQMRDGKIEVKSVPTKENYADLFTNNFAGPRHRYLMDKIG